MKNNKRVKESKYLILIIVFVTTAVITFISMNFEAVELYTTTMKAATLPVVEMLTEQGNGFNRLHGYTLPIDASLLNESLTPLSADKKQSIEINTYGSNVKAISYTVRNLSDHSLIENTEVTDFTQEESQVFAQLNIKNLIEDHVEYLLEIIISTDKTEKISYYTRIVSGTDVQLDDKLQFVRDFNGYTFQQSNNILQYIETSTDADNSNYGKVNINCTQSQINWGSLNPTLESEISATVKDVNDDVAILYLEYTMGAQNAYESYDTYHVLEYYRVRQTSTDMYLLNFERESNQVFDGRNDLTASSKINLGINAETDVHMMADESGKYTYFVNEGTLWCFNLEDKTYTSIFTFASEESDNVRERYRNHDYKIMNITADGDCNFLLYGYMNRGAHEGQVGISLFSYSYKENQVVERLFLPEEVPYERLVNSVGDVAYLAEQDEFYILVNDTLFSIDLVSKEVMVEVEGLHDGTYATSVNGSAIAYSTNGSLYESNEIRIFNMANNTEHFIQGADGEFLRALGYVGSDFIYGIANGSDILREESGLTTFPMYQINIMDSEYNIIKEYVPQGAYVSDAAVNHMRITLSRIVRDGERYSSTSIDQLINRDENNADEGLVTEIGTTTERKQELYIVLMNSIIDAENVSLRYSKEVAFNNEATPDMQYDFSGQSRYYVYGYGRFQGNYMSLEAAINKAYDTYGIVIDSRGKQIWNRYKSAESAISGLSVSAASGADSLKYAVSALGTFAGSREDLVAMMNAGASAKEVLDSVTQEKGVVVKGISVDKIISFVDAGQPVIGRTGTDSYVIITGYDATNITYIDMASLRTVTQKITDANKVFALLDNVFITYYGS